VVVRASGVSRLDAPRELVVRLGQTGEEATLAVGMNEPSKPVAATPQAV
jgi:hypothetical protein